LEQIEFCELERIVIVMDSLIDLLFLIMPIYQEM